MHFLFIILIALTILFLLITTAAKKKRQRKLENIRYSWGHPKNDYFNFPLIEKYLNSSKRPYFHKLSNQTVSDIDLLDLFQLIDRTTSKPGQQLLFDRLHKPTNDVTKLKDLHQKSIFFKEHVATREEVQLLLTHLADSNAYYITDLLQDRVLDRPKWLPLLYLNTALVMVLLVLLPKYAVMIVPLMFLFAVNLFLHYWNKNNTGQFTRSFPQLNNLINVAKLLSAKQLPFDSTLAKQSINSLGDFQKKVRLISFGSSGIKDELSQALYYFFDLLKALFLVELHALYNVTKKLENKQEAIDNLLQYVGAIDTSISIASLKDSSFTTCEPQLISASKSLKTAGLYHPLIADCLANAIYIEGKSVLITGSNMSGKSTFLRTVALNALMAQTLHTCFAESYIAPVFKLHSSIRIDDSLLDGKSYYFEEVSVMAALIEQIGQGYQNLFILDEVFKGTNTIERIAAAKAILSYLNKSDHLVLVATHDTELVDLLSDTYDLYHFTEVIVNNQLYFDHQLKTGPLQTRNAIRLLEIAAYPAEITEEARQISRLLMAANVG